MRPTILAGIALIVIGSFLFIRGGTFTTRRDVVKIGDLKISADEQHPVAPWIAGAAVAGGAILVLAGARRRA